MLLINELSLTTNTLLVENINLQLDKGKIYGLSAPNGSGKSTLMRTIAGLRNEKLGQAVLFDDGQLVPHKEIKKKIFYFESSTWFNPNLSGMDYLQLICDQWQSDSKRIEEIIAYWEMEKYISNPLKNYSLGMKQKVLLALYYVSDADYWLLDEPTIALDKSSVHLLKTFFLEQKELSRCLFFSAHENEDFFEICDQEFYIDYGVLKEK